MYRERRAGKRKLGTISSLLSGWARKTITNIEPDSYPGIASAPALITRHAIESVTPGSIILLHVMYVSRQASVAAVPGVVRKLRAPGYTFVTVSEPLTYGN